MGAWHSTGASAIEDCERWSRCRQCLQVVSVLYKCVWSKGPRRSDWRVVELLALRCILFTDGNEFIGAGGPGQSVFWVGTENRKNSSAECYIEI